MCEIKNKQLLDFLPALEQQKCLLSFTLTRRFKSASKNLNEIRKILSLNSVNTTGRYVNVNHLKKYINFNMLNSKSLIKINIIIKV